MQKEIVIDIETVPCADPVQVAYLLANVKPDPRLKDPVKVEADIAEKRAEVVGKTGLDGSFGRILCAAVCEVASGVVYSVSSAEVDEASVLTELLAHVDRMVNEDTNTALAPRIIGHNALWDLRFIAQRCAVHGIPFNKRILPFDAKPWGDNVADTMTLWAGTKGTITLDRLCVALGVPSPKGEMNGSMVAQYFADGRLAEIVDYNRADVQATRACYLKMKLAGMVA